MYCFAGSSNWVKINDMKILFYIDTIGFGGAERVIANLANQLLSKGCQTLVITTFRMEKEYSLDPRVTRYSMDKEYNAPFWKRNAMLLCRLRKVLRMENPDVAIAFLPESIFRLAIASWGFGITKIYSVRSDPRFVYRTRAYKLLAKLLLPSASGFVFQTEEAKEFFPPSIKKKSTIIFNQVAEEFYDVSIPVVRTGIVATGRLVPPKDHFLLVDAFELIKDRIGDNLTIYGDGPLRDKLHDYIISKGLQDRVLLPGSVSSVPNAISSAKVYVLSSNHEGMPNGLMEAMALGVPCVSTDCPCGGPKALFGERQKDLLVPVNDSAALADAILRVVESEELRSVLSAENKERALFFKPDVVLESWYSFINTVYYGKKGHRV